MKFTASALKCAALFVVLFCHFSVHDVSAQEHNHAGVGIENREGELIISVNVLHYSDNYKNSGGWANIPPGQRTTEPMRVDFNTGAFTTGRDWWKVMWTTYSPQRGYWFHQTFPLNGREGIEVMEQLAPSLVSLMIDQVMSKVICQIDIRASSVVPLAPGSLFGLKDQFRNIGKQIAVQVNMALNNESTVGFKQHILRSGDTFVGIIIAGEKVSFHSSSGASDTCAVARTMKFDPVRKMLVDNPKGGKQGLNIGFTVAGMPVSQC